MLPWVVTTAPFAAHLEKQQDSDCSWRLRIVQDEKITSEEENYILFRKIFEAVEIFNQGNLEHSIKTICGDLKFLNFPRGNPKKEAEGIRRGYLEHQIRV